MTPPTRIIDVNVKATQTPSVYDTVDITLLGSDFNKNIKAFLREAKSVLITNMNGIKNANVGVLMINFKPVLETGASTQGYAIPPGGSLSLTGPFDATFDVFLMVMTNTGVDLTLLIETHKVLPE